MVLLVITQKIKLVPFSWDLSLTLTGDRRRQKPEKKLHRQDDADLDFGQGKPLQPDRQIRQDDAVHPQRRAISERAAQLKEPGRGRRRMWRNHDFTGRLLELSAYLTQEPGPAYGKK